MLVAISIPIFTAQLEKSREATDEANLRSIYAQLSADVLLGDAVSGTTNVPVAASYAVTNTGGVVTGTATYVMKQSTAGFAGDSSKVVDVGGVKLTNDDFKTGTATITVTDSGAAPTITIK